MYIFVYLLNKYVKWKRRSTKKSKNISILHIYSKDIQKIYMKYSIKMQFQNILHSKSNNQAIVIEIWRLETSHTPN